MHALVIGVQPPLVESLVSRGHEVTLIHEAAQAARVRDLVPPAVHTVAIGSVTSPESILGALAYLGITAKIECVVPGNEVAVVPSAIVGELIGARSLPVRTALACRNKAVQKATWADIVPTARWSVLTGSDDDIPARLRDADIDLPCIAKPLDKGGTTDVGMVSEVNELQTRLAELAAPLLVEQYLEPPEWHLDGVIQSSEISHFMVSQYCSPVLDTKRGIPVQSMTYPGASNAVLYNAAREFTHRAVTSLDLTDGVFHLEAFGREGEFIAGELACRPGAGMIPQVGRIALGIDLWDAVGRLATDEPVPPAAARSQDYLGFVNLPSVAGEVNTVDITTFTELDWVVDVVERRAVGEIMRDMTRGVGFGMGYVMVRAATREDLRSRLDTVTDLMRTAQRNRTGIEL